MFSASEDEGYGSKSFSSRNTGSAGRSTTGEDRETPPPPPQKKGHGIKGLRARLHALISSPKAVPAAPPPSPECGEGYGTADQYLQSPREMLPPIHIPGHVGLVARMPPAPDTKGEDTLLTNQQRSVPTSKKKHKERKGRKKSSLTVMNV